MNNNLVKFFIDYGPIVGFFIAYTKFDLLVATAVLILLTIISLLVSIYIEKKVPIMPLVTALVVGFFGGLTLWLRDDTFIKMKPTIIQCLFAAILFIGLALKKPLLKKLMGKSWPMDEEGWMKLTRNFALFFLVMAALNEVVWRTQSTDFWVNFKVFGIMGLTFAFLLSQSPILYKHHIDNENGHS